MLHLVTGESFPFSLLAETGWCYHLRVPSQGLPSQYGGVEIMSGMAEQTDSDQRRGEERRGGGEERRGAESGRGGRVCRMEGSRVHRKKKP